MPPTRPHVTQLFHAPAPWKDRVKWYIENSQKTWNKLIRNLNYYYQQLFIYASQSSETAVITISIFLMEKGNFTFSKSSYLEPLLYFQCPHWCKDTFCLRWGSDCPSLAHSSLAETKAISVLFRHYLECARHWLQGQGYNGKQKKSCPPSSSLRSVTDMHRSDQQGWEYNSYMRQKLQSCVVQDGSHLPQVVILIQLSIKIKHSQ